MEKSPSW